MCTVFLSDVFILAAWDIMLCLYPDPAVKKEYCSVELSEPLFKAFAYAIKNHYWYQMYIGKVIHILPDLHVCV